MNNASWNGEGWSKVLADDDSVAGCWFNLYQFSPPQMVTWSLRRKRVVLSPVSIKFTLNRRSLKKWRQIALCWFIKLYPMVSLCEGFFMSAYHPSHEIHNFQLLWHRRRTQKLTSEIYSLEIVPMMCSSDHEYTTRQRTTVEGWKLDEHATCGSAMKSDDLWSFYVFSQTEQRNERVLTCS